MSIKNTIFFKENCGNITRVKSLYHTKNVSKFFCDPSANRFNVNITMENFLHIYVKNVIGFLNRRKRNRCTLACCMQIKIFCAPVVIFSQFFEQNEQNEKTKNIEKPGRNKW